MFGYDSFTVAVLGSAIVVLVVFALMILVDKGKPSESTATAPPKVAAPAKAAGKR